MTVGDIWKRFCQSLIDLFSEPATHQLGEHLVHLGATEVIARAISLGDTLVLPSTVLLRLPEDELRVVRSPRLLEGLRRSLAREVSRRAEPILARMEQQNDDRVALIGLADLEVRLASGLRRSAEAHFPAGADDATCVDDAPPEPFPAEHRPAERRPAERRPAEPHPLEQVPDDPQTLVVELRCDGTLLASRPVAGYRLLVGRDVACDLPVPFLKGAVSREALVIGPASGAGPVTITVLNRNGVHHTTGAAPDGGWGGARGGGAGGVRGDGGGGVRRHLPAEARVVAGPGDRFDLDPDGSVVLHVRAVTPARPNPPHDRIGSADPTELVGHPRTSEQISPAWAAAPTYAPTPTPTAAPTPHDPIDRAGMTEESGHPRTPERIMPGVGRTEPGVGRTEPGVGRTVPQVGQGLPMLSDGTIVTDRTREDQAS